MNTKSIIMRRVYYSYALSIFGQTVFWQGLFLGMATLLLGQWLHVSSVIKNFLAVPIGTVPQYIANTYVGAVAHGELLTVVMFTAALLVGMSVVFRLSMRVERPKTLSLYNQV